MSRRLLIGAIILLSCLVLLLLFRIFTITQSLNDVTMILAEQVAALREAAFLRRFSPTTAPLQWHHDALVVHGRMGDLLIRRHALQRHWAARYLGYQGAEQQRIRALIDDVDRQLVPYGLRLSRMSALTERMLEDVYHGRDAESARVTRNIMRHLRQL
jgi:hypothetical protein